MEPGSVGFDRAAEYYDRTRGVPPDVAGAQTSLLAGELSGRGRVLEVGVGTGQIALSLADAGVSMAGLDVSMPMLAKLVEKAGGRPPFPLALGDATRMPFHDDAFGGVVVRWVLHLIPDWRGAVAEMVRVVRPGGIVLVNLGGFKKTWEIVDHFLEAAGGVRFAVGLDPRDPGSLDREFERTGARPRPLPPIPSRDDTSIDEFLDEMRDGVHSWTWRVDADVRRRILPEVRSWAERRFGSLVAALEPDVEIVWRAYDLP